MDRPLEERSPRMLVTKVLSNDVMQDDENDIEDNLPYVMSEVALKTGVDEKKGDKFAGRIGMFGGPSAGFAVWLLLRLCEPQGLSTSACRLAGMTVWIATWWLTEPIPLGVTALMPLFIFPALQIGESNTVAQQYSLPLMWMFFGGFQLAFALQRAGLHQRIALKVLMVFGTKEAFLMLGIMFSVGILSMFLSNTSTTLMIVPVATAIVGSFGDTSSSTDRSADDFGKPLMLGLAYSASSGGIGSLLGTPPNGVLAVQGQPFGIHITFANWAMFGMPLSFIMIVLLWAYLISVFKVPFTEAAGGREGLQRFERDLGSVSQAEVRVGLVFLFTVVAWVSRKYVVEAVGLPSGTIEDHSISIFVTVLMFMIPAVYKDGQRKRLMDWETMLQTPWQLVFLFGGGFALADGFQNTGLSLWIGEQLAVLDVLPTKLLVLCVVLLVTFLTEVTSNTATANVLLPILGQTALTLGISPALLMVPATLAASCAFMLPVATPPNAIVFASGFVTMKDMARTGFIVNCLSCVLITFWMFTWGDIFFKEAVPVDASVPHNVTSGPVRAL